jgi:DNA-binding NarL/FixJ family response regulator
MMSRITVSLIDDDAVCRKAFCQWIKGTRGLSLLSEHADGRIALESLTALQPQVILLEATLGCIQGIDCLRLLKKKLSGVQLLVVTGCENPETVLRTIKAGASGYLLKPIGRRDLLAAIRDVHAGGSPMTSRISRILIHSIQSAEPAQGGTKLLSPRQSQTLALLAQGLLYKEIAEHLHIRVATVNAHARRIYEKLRVRSRGQAVARYLQLRDRKGVI